MIREQYVSFEVAKLLKEKGFDEPCQYFYKFCSNEIYRGTLFTNTQIGDKFYNAPTQQMAMRWLREVHHIHVCPEYKAFFQERPKKIYHHWCNKIIGIDRYFKQGIQDLVKLDSDYFFFRSCKTYHDSFEDACEECIEFSLKNLIEERKQQ